jgi:hypothetical protein
LRRGLPRLSRRTVLLSDARKPGIPVNGCLNLGARDEIELAVEVRLQQFVGQLHRGSSPIKDLRVGNG